MPLLFALTLFLAAALGFLVQPLIARQLLPLAGGSPAVWTTCLVFFQLVLLAGYVYADVLARRRYFEFVLTMSVLLLFIVYLQPFMLEPAFRDTESSPELMLLAMLFLSVGLPYFLLATTTPLVQSWYARRGRNPYPLYAASNAGSLLGLLAYPFIVEPWITIAEQRQIWKVGFAIVVVLIVLCGLCAGKPLPAVIEHGPRSRQFPRWLALSALTASLLASVTAHLSTDIAPMPLLWVVPLAIYLATYIVTFARWPERARRIMGRVAPMAICFSLVALLAQATEPIILVTAVHLFGLLCVCLLCHGELAASKPPPEQLTGFYLAIALGGVIGGSVNAILAPIVFTHFGPLEYPLGLVLAGLVVSGSPSLALRANKSDILWPLIILGLTLALNIGVSTLLPKPDRGDAGDVLIDRLVRGGLMFGVPIACCFALVWRPVRFTLCLAAVVSVGMIGRTANSLVVQRNFFGTLMVSRDGEYTVLTHGTTRHGMQKTGEEAPQPRMYYHRQGPLGRVFQTPAETIGVVGLGCGAMAAYAQPGQKWTFFEIDPGVVDIAKKHFTFLNQHDCDIVLGDARRKLMNVPDGTFDLLAIDAFSSDAVPVHLLTKEAFELYFRKLKTNGRLLLHLSNRYLDLPNLAGRVVKAVDPAKKIWEYTDTADAGIGKYASTWVMISDKPPRLFVPLTPQPGPVWSDDFAPLRGVWKKDE